MLRTPIVITEHQTYVPSEDFDIYSFLTAHNVELPGIPADYMGTPQCLAIDSTLTASYYIGATWLVERELPVIVLPKIPNIDYLEMFMAALSVDSKHGEAYFSKCYGIDFDKSPIETTENLSQLTPLLLVHYVTLMEQLARYGLKRDYVIITKNLKNKVKGSLVISQQIKKNIIYQRKNRNVCTYQVYTTDIPANRLLKRALLFAQAMLLKLLPSNKRTGELQARINKIMTAFVNVSDNIEVSAVKYCGGSKLFRYYEQAIKVAKDILHRYDYSLSNISKKNHFTPCFWIDMSRLFELYVYSKLYHAYQDNIRFQVPGYRKTAVDFIHIGERLIIDAKYKPKYEMSYTGIVPDIREISGYSRDLSILKNFGSDFIVSNKEVRCLIIYPQNAFTDLIRNDDNILQELQEMDSMNEFLTTNTSLWNQASPMKYFRNFRKLRIPLPTVV